MKIEKILQPTLFFQNKQTNKQANQTNNNTVKNNLAIGTLAMAVIGIAGVALAKKMPKSLSKIDFKQGIAYVSNGKKYSGKAQTFLSSGNKAVLEYENGILKKSTITGTKNITKTFFTNSQGEKIVKITEDGKSKTINLTSKIKEVKIQQAKLEELLKQKNSYTSSVFKEKTDEITFKNRKQIDKIKEEYATKKAQEKRQAIIEAQQAQERAEREAQEAKRRAEREAQEAKERAEREAQEAKRRAEREAQEAKERAEREAQEENEKNRILDMFGFQGLRERKNYITQETMTKREEIFANHFPRPENPLLATRSCTDKTSCIAADTIMDGLEIAGDSLFDTEVWYQLAPELDTKEKPIRELVKNGKKYIEDLSGIRKGVLKVQSANGDERVVLQFCPNGIVKKTQTSIKEGKKIVRTIIVDLGVEKNDCFASKIKFFPGDHKYIALKGGISWNILDHFIKKEGVFSDDMIRMLLGNPFYEEYAKSNRLVSMSEKIYKLTTEGKGILEQKQTLHPGKFRKKIEHLDNGNTVITLYDSINAIQIIRDKKGKIIQRKEIEFEDLFPSTTKKHNKTFKKCLSKTCKPDDGQPPSTPTATSANTVEVDVSKPKRYIRQECTFENPNEEEENIILT